MMSLIDDSKKQNDEMKKRIVELSFLLNGFRKDLKKKQS